MDPTDLYGILRVRQDVFIVEQDCAYPDIDGIDLHPETIQHWISDHTGVVSTMRSYVVGAVEEQSAMDATGAMDVALGRQDGSAAIPGIVYIGRVSTHPRARHRGYSRRLMDTAIARLTDDYPSASIHIGAQAYLQAWYETFGYRVSGDGYLEDGIAHVPMTLLRDGVGDV